MLILTESFSFSSSRIGIPNTRGATGRCVRAFTYPRNDVNSYSGKTTGFVIRLQHENFLPLKEADVILDLW